MTKKFLKDMVNYLPAQILPAIIGFITIPVITRLFSPTDYGNYSLVMATVMVLTTLLGWLPMSIVRFFPSYERDNKLEMFYGNVVKLTFFSIAIITFIYCNILLFLKTRFSLELFFLMLAGIAVFITLALFNVFLYFLRAERKVNWYTHFSLFRTLVSFGFGLGFIFLFKFGIEGLLWGMILSTVIIFPSMWTKTIRNKAIIHYKINSVLLKEMMNYGLPLVVGNLAAWILSLSDRYILEYFRGSHEVGLYSASYGISEKSIMLLAGLFTLSAGPIQMHIWEKEGKEKSKDFLLMTTRYYLIVCIPVAVCLSVLSRTLIIMLVGPQYFDGYKIIPLVVFGIVLYGLQQQFQSGLVFYKKTGLITIAIVSAGVLNLILNFIYIPRYGYFAAAITTLISYILLLILMIILSRKFLVWQFPFRTLINVICASVIMAMAVYFIGNKLTSSIWLILISSFIIGPAIYILILFILREPQKKEIENLRIFLERIPWKVSHNEQL